MHFKTIRQAAFAVLISSFTLADSHAADGAAVWIWSPQATAGSAEAPEGDVYFRKMFELPEKGVIQTAAVDVGVDNDAEIFLNGKPAGTGHGWNPLTTFDAKPLLRPGKNVLSVKARNAASGPAGLLLNLRVEYEGNGGIIQVATSDSWSASTAAVAGWQTETGSLEGFVPAKILAQNGSAPWGLCLPVANGETLRPVIGANGTELSGLNDMLGRFLPACNIENAGTYALAWLPRAMLWAGDVSPIANSVTRARVANRLSRIRISDEGYVSCHQHEGLAHSEGWPFPLPSQHEGMAYYFTMTGIPYGPEFGLKRTESVEDWQVSGAKAGALDKNKGWAIEITEANATATSPAFVNDAFLMPFVRVKWDATDLPKDIQPYLEWTTEAEPEFAVTRRVPFPKASQASSWPTQDFDIPIHPITKAAGKITRFRIGFGSTAVGKVNLMRIFSAVDSRHTINNSNYLIASADYHDWTGDRKWLVANLEKLRRATAYMVSEFQVEKTHLLRTPWIGHDGRSGIEYKADKQKIIHPGVGIGGNYWDLIPFGGDDALGTIYMYSALSRMAQLEDLVAAEKLAPASGKLDGRALHGLAKAVREQFQKTFWNPVTKRFAPKNDKGEFQDYGFTFLNNEALFYGLASDDQARDVLSWTGGERKVEGDTSQGADIYHFKFGPRSTTKRNIEYYAYVWSRPEDLEFGDQVQDGGAVLGFTYHDLMARISHLGADNAWTRLQGILKWYQDVKDAGGARPYYAVPGRGKLQGGGTAGGVGIDEEFYESVLVPAIILDGFIGFSVRPDGFDLHPHHPAGVKNLMVSNVAYRDLLWDIEATPGAVTFRVQSGKVDAPLRVGLPDGTWIAKMIEKKGDAETTIPINSETSSFFLPAGPLHELILSQNQ